MPWLSSSRYRWRSHTPKHLVPGVSGKMSSTAEGPWLGLGRSARAQCSIVFSKVKSEVKVLVTQ